MAKKTHIIGAFEGGINTKNDPRDIADNQLEEIVNMSVSSPGQITLPGDGKAHAKLLNAAGHYVSPGSSTPRLDYLISNGYGLFTFMHDYNMNEDSTYNNGNPVEVNDEFLCISDGPFINIWDSCPQDNSRSVNGKWYKNKIILGRVGRPTKSIYYKPDSGLRICDAGFTEAKVSKAMVSGQDLTSTGTSLSVI